MAHLGLASADANSQRPAEAAAAILTRFVPSVRGICRACCGWLAALAGERQRLAEDLLDMRKQANGEQGIAAKIKEVLLDADAFQAQ